MAAAQPAIKDYRSLWYNPEAPVTDATKRFFAKYCSIPENEVEDHVRYYVSIPPSPISTQLNHIGGGLVMGRRGIDMMWRVGGGCGRKLGGRRGSSMKLREL
jgi:hypothetical protein